MNLYTFKHHSDYSLEIIQVVALDVDSAYSYLSKRLNISESMLRSRYGNPITEFQLSNPHGVYESEYIEICDLTLEREN